MRATVGQIRRLIREEAQRQSTVNELFGKKADLGSVLDDVLQDLLDANKKVEKAHELAPQGPAKAIVAGLHSDLFNKASEFRKYVEQLKALVKKGSG